MAGSKVTKRYALTAPQKRKVGKLGRALKSIKAMNPIIPEPQRISIFLRLAIRIAERVTGKRMLPARILSWFPRAAIGSGLLESMAAHGRTDQEKRLLRLVRLQTAFTVSCPFCIDMNAFEFEGHGVSRPEFEALRAGFPDDYPESISSRERAALEYSQLISATPLEFPPDFIERLTAEFSEREIVMLAATASQVNYWGRLIQSLGIPPAGFSPECRLSQSDSTKSDRQSIDSTTGNVCKITH